MSIRRILTGIRPTGPLHLGHYVGALKQWVSLQNDYECFFLMADIQALTTHIDQPQLIEDSVREVALDWMGVGLDPNKPNINFVLQSAVPELTELTTYLSMLAPFSEVKRNPTIKKELIELKKKKKSPTAGFMIYPVSQAADILLFSPDPADVENRLLVPVGEDQVPHLEGTNKLARRFNRAYGQVFLECKPKVGEIGRLVGTDGSSKMSKSAGNVIQLKDDPDTVSEIVKKMFTDKKKIHMGDPGHPSRCPVYRYHQVFGTKETLKGRYSACHSGRLGCVACKKDLIEILNAFLDPIRARRANAEYAPLPTYLQQGTDAAREICQATILKVRKAMHLDYPSVFK